MTGRIAIPSQPLPPTNTNYLLSRSIGSGAPKGKPVWPELAITQSLLLPHIEQQVVGDQSILPNILFSSFKVTTIGFNASVRSRHPLEKQFFWSIQEPLDTDEQL
jgi:hypothetical protein